MTPRDEAQRQTSSSMEEVAAKRPEEVRAPTLTAKPGEAPLSPSPRTPPQSALRADSSSVEEERGAWFKFRARQMRTEMTPHEKAMWRLLREGELVALNWRRQVRLGDYIVDFASHPARIVIEVDGGQHADAEALQRDVERTDWLRGEGYRVLRFWNADVLKASDGVWRSVQEAALETPAASRIHRWRKADGARVERSNARIASPSMEEAPQNGGGGVRSVVTTKAQETNPVPPLASPPQSSLRDDSSSIEEERF